MLRLRSAARSETGPVRRRNEDRFLCEEALGLFGVADGVGGMPGGAEAAQAARDSLLESFRALGGSASPDLRLMVERANAAVRDAGAAHPSGIATTLTFGCLRGGEFRLGHVGDSRAYVLEDGSFQRLTEDHNVENEARRKAARGESAPFSRADAHAITRCLGNRLAPDAEWAIRRLAAPSRYLFCTDGVTGAVSDEELGRFLAAAREPEEILRELTELVLRRGAPDNATSVLVFIDEV